MVNVVAHWLLLNLVFYPGVLHELIVMFHLVTIADKNTCMFFRKYLAYKFHSIFISHNCSCNESRLLDWIWIERLHLSF